jgi:hypothetical protein
MGLDRLDMCQGGLKMILGSYDKWQGGFKMMWMNVYDHRICYDWKKHCWKEIELIYWGNTQILIFEFE